MIIAIRTSAAVTLWASGCDSHTVNATITLLLFFLSKWTLDVQVEITVICDAVIISARVPHIDFIYLLISLFIY